MTEEKKKINWLSYIRRGIIIFIVIYGSFAPLYGPFDLGTVFFLIYIVLFIYYLVKILKAIFILIVAIRITTLMKINF